MIDTGVDDDHPDLEANMWINEGEIPGNNIDDDGNGFVDDEHGYDFANNDGDPSDDNGHGTHVAGTVAALGDNSIGVIGVAFGAQIMGLKFLDANGSGFTSDAIGAIDYAVTMGAHVLNNSWGGGGFSQSLLEAIEFADEEGVLFVAAAGNSGTDNDVTPHYPSNYDVPNIISVASTNRFDDLSFFSNFGVQTVDLAGPGSEILSTVPGNGYGFKSGTSMATPHVSGAAALLYAQSLPFPGDPPTPGVHLSVKSQLLASVDPLESLTGKVLTGGRLNAFGNLISKWLSVGVLEGQVPVGASISFPVQFKASGLPTDVQQDAFIVVRSNDPGVPESVLPVTLFVQTTTNLSGRVHFYDDPAVGVEGVDVTLSPLGATTVSDPEGQYLIPGILPGDYALSMAKAGDTQNAIQGSDALTILQKTAFLLPEELSADQALAADITGDGSLDNSDALGILRFLAFFPDGIGQTGTWFFEPNQVPVTSGGVVPDVKVYLRGDLLPDWGRPALSKRSGSPPATVDASGAQWKGDRLTLPIQVRGGEPVGSLLLSLNYDPALFRYEATRLTDSGRDYLLVDNGEQEGRIHIALAGIPPAGGEGAIFEVVLRTHDAAGEVGPLTDGAELTFDRLVVNDFPIPVGTESVLTVRRIPEQFELVQNYPNPFNPQTQIRFGLPEQTQARLILYNTLGQVVRVLVDENLEPGYHTVVWNGLTSGGKTASSGVYIYRLQTSSGFTETRRMLLLK